MSYTQQNLLPNERVIFKGMLHWYTLCRPLAIMVAGFAFSLPLFAQKNPAGAMGLIGIGLLLGGLPLIGQLINRSTSEFCITNRRLVIKVGLIRRSTLELFVEKVESLQVEQSMLGRMLNFGTLTVNGSGASHGRFKGIASPMEFRNAFYTQVETATKKAA